MVNRYWPLFTRAGAGGGGTPIVTCRVQSTGQGAFRNACFGRVTLAMRPVRSAAWADFHQNANIHRLQRDWFRPVLPKAQEKVTVAKCPLESQRQILDEIPGAGLGPAMLLAPSKLSALLSLALQCIHVSGEPSFSSENKLLWEFLVHGVSFSHTKSCLIILNLLTIDSGRRRFSPRRKLYHPAAAA